MATYISNAISCQMLGRNCRAEIKPVELVRVRQLLGNRDADGRGWQSCVGHADVARVISSRLGMEVPVNRVSVYLDPGDVVFVGQYLGPRLPEGAAVLPEGAVIDWYEVRVKHATRNRK